MQVTNHENTFFLTTSKLNETQYQAFSQLGSIYSPVDSMPLPANDNSGISVEKPFENNDPVFTASSSSENLPSENSFTTAKLAETKKCSNPPTLRIEPIKLNSSSREREKQQTPPMSVSRTEQKNNNLSTAEFYPLINNQVSSALDKKEPEETKVRIQNSTPNNPPRGLWQTYSIFSYPTPLAPSAPPAPQFLTPPSPECWPELPEMVESSEQQDWNYLLRQQEHQQRLEREQRGELWL